MSDESISNDTFSRPDGRAIDEMRAVSIEPGIAPHADGSVICGFGNTRVICAAMIEDKVPGWMQRQKVEGGWLTAEYNMLPYSTFNRKNRPISQGRQDGRNIEIQRLIGRSLRACTDLKKLPGKTLWVDCDVLQADGGTRTASITGAWVAAQLAFSKLLKKGKIEENPLSDHLSAISVGVYQDTCLLDLCYIEDRDATVDANVVMTGSGEFVEVQSSGEEATYSREQLDELLALASKGCVELVEAQKTAVAEA